MSKWSTRQIATAAIIAALYTVMSLLSSIFGLTYGPHPGAAFLKH